MTLTATPEEAAVPDPAPEALAKQPFVILPETTLFYGTAPDSDTLMLDGIDTSAKPLFTVSEMATFFFARSSHWVRWLETCQFVNKKRERCLIAPIDHTKKMAEAHRHTWKLFFDGELLVPLRTSSNARQYDLSQVEKMAHSLASKGAIQGEQLRWTLALVRIQAEMHGYLTDPMSRLIDQTQSSEPEAATQEQQ